MLSVAVGIVFMMLLLSLLASTIMEFISAFLGLRGKNLEKALKNMLAPGGDESIFNAFKDNALYQQLAGKFFGKNTPPSYLNAETFRSIYLNVLGGIESLEKNIQHIPNGKLKDLMYQLLEDADFNLKKLPGKIENWYDEVMERSSGWYKRNVSRILIAVGLILAVIFNADTIAVYSKLSKDPASRLEVVAAAQEYINNNQDVTQSAEQAKSIEALQKDIETLLTEEISKQYNPLGIGWNDFDSSKMDFWAWVLKVIGWAITGLSITLGAPFWFNLLNLLFNIRGTGFFKEKGLTEEEPATSKKEVDESVQEHVRHYNSTRSAIGGQTSAKVLGK